MGKIIGKSALSLAGLVAASWLVYLLNDWLPFAFSPSVFSLFYLTCIQYSLYFLSAILYSYVLYRLFRNENRCCMIILLNGIFVILQFYILLFLSADTVALTVSFVMSTTAGYTAVLLSLLFKRCIRPICRYQEAFPAKRLEYSAYSVNLRYVSLPLLPPCMDISFSALMCCLNGALLGFIWVPLPIML